MAKGSKKDKKQDGWLRRWRQRYQVVLVNEKTFEEKSSFRASRLGVFTIIAAFAVLLITLSVLAIFLTPLRTLTEGYGDSSLRDVGELNSLVLDEVVESNRQYELYYDNLNNILNGTIGDGDSLTNDTVQAGLYDSLDLNNSVVDSAFRKDVEDASAYALDFNKSVEENSARNVYFFTPLRGRITSSFNAKKRHFGIDVAANENESAKATLEGTVVFASWTPDDGHVLHIQHSHNYLSVYKHNAVLHKQVGDRVKAGENVSIIGNTGENTTGPHLHFELWHNGIPVDPQKLIVFE